MRIQRASITIIALVFAFYSAANGVSAQTPSSAIMASPAPHMAAAGPPANALVRVSDCNPKLNLMQSGGYAAYAPGWPGGYWGDPYGVRYYQPPVTSADPQVAIHYTNISHKVMSQIEFGLVASGVLVAEVRDVGKFSPGAEIKHKFGLSANVFPIRTGLPQCVPLRITFADGTKWRNPALPPRNQHIYYNP